MVIFQKPNPPLIIAALGFILAKLSTGIMHKSSASLFTIAIIVWAYLEITTGLSWFRKLLGVIVVLWTFFSLYQQLR